MREQRREERMRQQQLACTSAASAPVPERRGGAGLSAGPPALVRGEEEPGGRCSRREENDASREGYPRRLIFSLFLIFILSKQIFIPQISLHPNRPLLFCTAQPNLSLSHIKTAHAELGQNAPSRQRCCTVARA